MGVEIVQGAAADVPVVPDNFGNRLQETADAVLTGAVEPVIPAPPAPPADVIPADVIPAAVDVPVDAPVDANVIAVDTTAAGGGLEAATRAGGAGAGNNLASPAGQRLNGNGLYANRQPGLSQEFGGASGGILISQELVGGAGDDQGLGRLTPDNLGLSLGGAQGYAACNPRVSYVTNTQFIRNTIYATKTRALPTTIYSQITQTYAIPTTIMRPQYITSVAPPIVHTSTAVSMLINYSKK